MPSVSKDNISSVLQTYWIFDSALLKYWFMVMYIVCMVRLVNGMQCILFRWVHLVYHGIYLSGNTTTRSQILIKYTAQSVALYYLHLDYLNRVGGMRFGERNVLSNRNVANSPRINNMFWKQSQYVVGFYHSTSKTEGESWVQSNNVQCDVFIYSLCIVPIQNIDNFNCLFWNCL